jgi:hypothetical protein
MLAKSIDGKTAFLRESSESTAQEQHGRQRRTAIKTVAHNNVQCQCNIGAIKIYRFLIDNHYGSLREKWRREWSRFAE